MFLAQGFQLSALLKHTNSYCSSNPATGPCLIACLLFFLLFFKSWFHSLPSLQCIRCANTRQKLYLLQVSEKRLLFACQEVKVGLELIVSRDFVVDHEIVAETSFFGLCDVSSEKER